MYPQVDETPLHLEGFQQLQLVLDLIYNPLRTRLLMEAEALHIPARGGLLMLAGQAQEAARLWGLIGEEDMAAQMAEEVEKTTRNIALIGMPGCGKTRIANQLALLTGRRVLDTDDMVHKAQGLHPRDLIAQHGEEAFRAMETKADRKSVV